MSMPDPNAELRMRQWRFSDYNFAAMISCMGLVLTLMNLYEYFVNVKNLRKFANIMLLVAILTCLQNSSIKVFEAALYYPNFDFPVWVDSWKSYMGQLCNPLACYCMSLRAAALYKGNRVLNIVIQVFAYTVLLAGVGVATFREYLTYAHYGNEDKVMGGARTTTGAFSNLFSSICQILFAFLFFYQLARFLMAETPKEKRQKKIILVSAVVECILILGCTIYYAIARPLGYKTASAILPLIAAMSFRVFKGQKDGSSDNSSNHARQTGDVSSKKQMATGVDRGTTQNSSKAVH